MADVVPDSIEKTQYADTSVNKPASGTYGEKADLARLKAELPSSQPQGGPAGPAPMQVPPGGPIPQTPGRPPNSNLPPGVPNVLGHPTERPNVPLGTRLVQPQQSPVRAADSAKNARIALLMALKNSPDVSEATREWATLVLEALSG